MASIVAVYKCHLPPLTTLLVVFDGTNLTLSREKEKSPPYNCTKEGVEEND